MNASGAPGVDPRRCCVQNMQLSTDYIYLLNPDFLIQIVLEYVHFSPQSADQSTAAAGSDNSVLKRVVQILEQIVRFLPGLQQAGFLLARSHFQAGSLDKSRQLLEQCLQADQAFSAGHILMAQIHLQSGNHKLADHALEVGLSHNFQVRESALFHLIKGRILLGQDGKAAEAKKTLQFAMQLPGVRKPAANSSGGIVLSPADRLSVYLELAEALRQ